MKIIIGADVVPTAFSEPLFKEQQAEKLFSDVLPIMQNADRTIVNLECALTETNNPIVKFGPNIKAHPDCAKTLKLAGVTDVMLANNHVFDFGVDGLVDTVEALKNVGLPYAGVGNDDVESREIYYIEQEGKKIGIVNVVEHEYTYATPNRMGANPFDPFLTMQDVRKAKKNSDFVIVIYQGGKEHCQYPSPRLRSLCQELVFNGASVVLCQHSHCIGCYEKINDGHIVYGQGNFHFAFEGAKTELWDTALLVELNINDEIDVMFHPIVRDNASVSLAKGETYHKIMNGFAKRNESLHSGEWKKGWHDFCVSVRENYDSVIYNATKDAEERTKQHFAHYLDCEAHTDVWRELFPTWNYTNDLDNPGRIK